MIEREHASQRGYPGLAPGSQPGGVESLHRSLGVWTELSDTSAEIDSESRLKTLDRMAQAFMASLQINGGRLEHLQDFELRLSLPRADASQIRRC